MSPVEYVTIGIYLLFLLGIGIYLSKANRNVSDYVRGGAQGTWWLVGSSAFMSSISAYTFTANAGLAYEGGPTPLFIFIGIAAGLVVSAAFTGPWLRQSRAITVLDIIRRRFGPEVEQFSVYLGLFTAPIAASIQLWALSVFCSAVFGFPIVPTIVTLGLVVLVYSTTGGRWAVMATDFLQSLILVPLTLLIAYLCLDRIGGIGAFLEYFSKPEFASDYKIINEPGEFTSDRFTWTWTIAMFCAVFFNEISIERAPKYLSVKDGREARKSALLSLVLIAFGGIIFLLPGMTSRFLFSETVMASSMENPAQSAYAVAALELLPNGLSGILIIAMLAATMSSMDTGLNANTGGIVNNLIPALRRRFRLQPLQDDSQILLCKAVTLMLGAIIITYAILWELAGEIDIFDSYTILTTIIAVPLGFPFALCLFIKKLPRWSYFFMAGCGLIPSLVAEYDKRVHDAPWTFQEKLLWVFAVIAVAALISRCFYRFSAQAYKERIETLFTQMRTPVDYQAEVKENKDDLQLQLMGNTSLLGSGMLALLIFLPNDLDGRAAILFIAAFVFVVGFLLKRAASKGDSES